MQRAPDHDDLMEIKVGRSGSTQDHVRSRSAEEGKDMETDIIDCTATKQTISHVNLHYPTPADGPLAAAILQAAGLVQTQQFALPQGGTFYRFTANHNAPNQADNIVYLSPLPSATAALYSAAREALGFGTPAEHPAVASYRIAQAADPEFDFHVGFLVDSLDYLERRFAALQALERDDPRFAGRMEFVVNRAPPGDPEIDARLDASPVYAGVTRYTYGRHGVQAFCKTDLIADGPLGEGLVIEFDYVFPGHEDHIMAVSAMRE
jgi:hypothetical protein